MRMKWGAPLLALTLLAGCVSPEAEKELDAAALPSHDAPMTLTGEKVDQCLRYWRGPKAVMPKVAVFSSALTRQFASSVYSPLARDAAQEMVYAKQIKAYVVSFQHKGFFGTTHNAWIACYYGLKDGDLVFLTMIEPDANGTVLPGDFRRTVSEAERKLSGNSNVHPLWRR